MSCIGSDASSYFYSQDPEILISSWLFFKVMVEKLLETTCHRIKLFFLLHSTGYCEFSGSRLWAKFRLFALLSVLEPTSCRFSRFALNSSHCVFCLPTRFLTQWFDWLLNLVILTSACLLLSFGPHWFMLNFNYASLWKNVLMVASLVMSRFSTPLHFWPPQFQILAPF